MMSEQKSDETFWKGMVKKHWLFFVILGLLVVGLIIGFFTILLTYVTNSELGGYGLWNLGQFSVGTAIGWFLLLILWEFLLGFLPFLGACCIFVAIYWFVITSDEDKAEFKAREKREKKRKHHSEEGSGITALFSIAFLIVVFVEGHWLTPVGNLPYSYWIQAWLTGFIWVCIIIGIPALVIVILYLVFRSKRKSE